MTSSNRIMNTNHASHSLLNRHRRQAWWRHQMEAFSALLAIYAGNSSITGEFPAQRPVTRSFDIFFDLSPNERLSKQSWGCWFETSWCPLWRHSNVQTTFSNAFSGMKLYKFRLRFHWTLFARVQLTIFQHWFRQWLGAVQATSHYLNLWWLVYWRIYASLDELTQCWFSWPLLGTFQLLHNEYDGVSNHRRIDCLLNRLFRRRSKKTSKLRVTGLCEGI